MPETTTTPPNLPLSPEEGGMEDIFADVETPPGVSEEVFAHPAMQPPAPSNAVSSPPAPPVLEEPEHGGRKGLKILVIVVVVLAVVGGGIALAWKLGWIGPKETEPAPVAGEELIPPDNEEEIPQDADFDGLSDFQESELGTDPKKPDTDDDGLFDRDEVKVYKTDPLNPDTDSDGYKDGEEVANMYDPTKGGGVRLFNFPPQ